MKSNSTALVESKVHRQNILNNPFVINEMKQVIDVEGLLFENELKFSREEVATLLDIDIRTLNRYIVDHQNELSENGYIVLKGKKLKEFKSLQHVKDTHVLNKSPQYAVFNLKAVLNLAMLIKNSDRAKQIRNRMLDIVMDVLANKTGGHAKYINQQDTEYLESSFQEENYRKQFTSAINKYIQTSNPYKYAKYTNLVYQTIFNENASEYRKILNLAAKENVRNTMYAEVLDLIASFETGFAHELQKESELQNKKLTSTEADNLFKVFSAHPSFIPLITKARTKMASRDLCFRDALHKKLEVYIESVPEADFERFLGEKSKQLQAQIEQNINVFKRLKDK
ncbi:hypothetical protein [Maridesulfovibrio frigidus]|uniref:hypothetical protein n=1 Tax=Maridesulfovibrio frigidus TaxID=340956 RepID=UPI0004E118D9|nr:hypothetical protein [Maridesulfovibrio frigidus]